jgi:hypothetical protein
MEFDLQPKQLKNDLLKKLLDEAQEYRCSPDGEAEAPAA